MNKKVWTKEEIEILKEYAPKVYIRELSKILDRTEAAIITKARKLGIDYITTSKKISEEDVEYIKNNWGKIPVVKMAQHLHVSRSTIQKQADEMNLPKLGNNPYKKWTEEEILILKELSQEKTISELAKYFKTTNKAIISIAYNNSIKLIDSKVVWTNDDKELLREYAEYMSAEEIAKKMNRSTNSIRIQAKRQNITIKPSKINWTEKDDEKLKELVSKGCTILQILEYMDFTEMVILKHARELNLTINKQSRKWTKEEEDKLVELAQNLTLNQITKKLNRTSSSVLNKANQLKITIKKDRKNWTEEEYQKLEDLINEGKEVREIANILNRTENSIIIKISRRGLKLKAGKKRYWTKEEEELLEELWGTKSIDYIAKKLNRTVSSIGNKAFSLKLGSQIDNNYDGITLQEIREIFKISDSMMYNWLNLGLKTKKRKISSVTSYKYVEIDDLYEFLEKHQNIWDASNLEQNILGAEPDWLKEKRMKDLTSSDTYGLDNLTKQQLIKAKKYFLDNKVQKNNDKIKKYLKEERHMIK